MFYRYEAVDGAGKVVMGTMDAPDEAAVAARLTQMGFRAQSVVAAPGQAAAAPPQAAVRKSASGLPRASAREMALFFRQFAALARAGITLYQALEHLAGQTQEPALREAARQMAEAARTGGRVSDVMERHPRLFPEHATATVRAGELGGFLEVVLDEIALDYEQELAFYKGLAVPEWMILQSVFAIAVAQAMFPALFPPPPNFPLFLQRVFLRNVPIALLVLLAGRCLWLRLQDPSRRRLRDSLALRIPVFGELARQKSLASFIRTLRRLHAAGLGPISAWEGAMNVAANGVIRQRLNEAHALIRQNVPLHTAFAATGLFATEAEQLLATGMVSGQMVDMLDRVAAYYQDNVDRAFSTARFWMFRIASSLFLALSGAVLIVLVKSYFDSVFRFTEGWLD